MSQALKELLRNPDYQKPVPENFPLPTQNLTTAPYLPYNIVYGKEFLNSHGEFEPAQPHAVTSARTPDHVPTLTTNLLAQAEAETTLTWERGIPGTVSLQDYVDAASIENLGKLAKLDAPPSEDDEKAMAYYLWGCVQLLTTGEKFTVETVEDTESDPEATQARVTFANGAAAFRAMYNEKKDEAQKDVEEICAYHDDDSDSMLSEISEVVEHTCGNIFQEEDKSFFVKWEWLDEA